MSQAEKGKIEGEIQILTVDFHHEGAAGHVANIIKSLALIISIIWLLDWVESQRLVAHAEVCCIVGVNKIIVLPPPNSVHRSNHLTMHGERLVKYCWSTCVIHHDWCKWVYRTRKKNWVIWIHTCELSEYGKCDCKMSGWYFELMLICFFES